MGCVGGAKRGEGKRGEEEEEEEAAAASSRAGTAEKSMQEGAEEGRGREHPSSAVPVPSLWVQL